MKKSQAITIQLVLLVAGTVGWVWQGTVLKGDGMLDHEPNILHLKRSPFGRTLALAMRGPVDVYWHRGEVHDHLEGEACAHGCEHAHGPECASGCDHDHGGEHEGDLTDQFLAFQEEISPEAHDPEHPSEEEPPQKFKGLRLFLLDRIDVMRTDYYSRTNHRVDTRFHKAYIMGEAQKRLAVSYKMDPSNLSGYGAYFLFLSEALARVEEQEGEDHVITIRRRAAHTLAHTTLEYCLSLRDEAPAMITAATAAHDCIQIVLEAPEPDRTLASEYLRLLDGTLHQYQVLKTEMIEEGTWVRFPESRRTEMEKAHSLVRMLRKVDHEMMGRLTERTPEPGSPPKS